MRRIDHRPRPHEYPHVGHAADAVPALAPEKHVPRRGLRAGDMRTHAGMVLLLRGAGDGAVPGLARRVFCAGFFGVSMAFYSRWEESRSGKTHTREAGAVEADEVVAR